MGYCNSEKPKIFELTDDPNICVLSYNRYKRCPHGLERLSDCSCKRPCHDGGYTRDPYRDFVCTRKDSTVLISPSNSKLLTVNVRLQPAADGLQLSYSYSIERDISVSILKILYRKMKGHRAMALPDIVLDADGSPQHVDIKPLHPGRSYLFKVTLFYEHNDNMENRTIQMIGTAQPNPVRNLTSSYNSESIQLSWKIPHQSEQDRYGVEYRPVRRNRKPGWIHNTTRQCNFTISHPFPGEEYELRVYSISNAINSLESTTCLVIPPLPPQELHVHFPSPTDVDVFWFTNDSRSHVEKWYLTYNTSNGDGDHMDVSYPDHGGRVVASLANVQRGYIYNIFVYGVVGDVRSTLPVYSEVKIPGLKEDLPETSKHLWIIYIVGVLVLLLIAVIVLVKKVPLICNFRNNIQIERLVTFLKGGSTLNLNIANEAVQEALNDIADDSEESDDER
ncbi:uncharacterized protein LOC132739256 isoform X1 [Ruditapes philippinarum]|uniref:uncharacterized protein LOC132739256 isoform X1 n=1 Tax=Ruditapes philippinarum TaxID=129788 RepID=UPI00295AA9CC|nr:uncharacterized protein LOC132739256 isoform X1 [Ruditapes philippinarum]XP_060582907.1 uncharacterized protein LOC132739256 isoform X1 [Ruditapes philippinarum]XP_060582908.1 uncharacterized protein LOC132739256 isoform X1 [Ruditapes philippinarum]